MLVQVITLLLDSGRTTMQHSTRRLVRARVVGCPRMLKQAPANPAAAARRLRSYGLFRIDSTLTRRQPALAQQ